MVREIEHEGRAVFVCKVCGFGYADASTASQCQDWCSKHSGCSVEIARKAIYRPTH